MAWCTGLPCVSWHRSPVVGGVVLGVLRKMYQSSFINLSFTSHRSSSFIHHSSFIIHHSSSLIVHHLPFTVHRSRNHLQYLFSTFFFLFAFTNTNRTKRGRLFPFLQPRFFFFDNVVVKPPQHHSVCRLRRVHVPLRPPLLTLVHSGH
jgi:hypothetical protein